MILAIPLHAPPVFIVFPFVFLLILIAAGPVLMPKFWHNHYKAISILAGLLVSCYYLLAMNNVELPVETLFEYISFISLLTLLYIASGGIYLFVDFESKATVNIVFLFLAAILTNIIGTTGASVLFIRPFMRLNRYRLKPYHIIFFIFIVSNIGGSLTPVGDPPLFMGFLKGVPFHWTITHLWAPWVLTIVLLLLVFYFFERKNTAMDEVDVSQHYTNKIIVHGKRNVLWLIFAISTVFLDPNIIDNLPVIEYHENRISFLRELIQLSAAFLCYRFANKKALQGNNFDFEPIKEVSFLFFGIFLCMMPALQRLEMFSFQQEGNLVLNPSLIYWSSGFLSGILDNAPTYLNVFALLLSNAGLDMNNIKDVNQFLGSEGSDLLTALSTGAVFFGAMTYIGNGPNFMVKTIAEQSGVKMPGFGAYILRYSLPVLLPVLALVWLLFII